MLTYCVSPLDKPFGSSILPSVVTVWTVVTIVVRECGGGGEAISLI